jgi:hypothetical protein
MMKNFILIAGVLMATVVLAGETAHKANRKPAANGTINYNGPLTSTDKGGYISITGPAALSIYKDMNAVTPSTDPNAEKIGRGIVCRLFTDGSGQAVCEMNFADITNGVITPTGPWVWAPAPKQ